MPDGMLSGLHKSPPTTSVATTNTEGLKPYETYNGTDPLFGLKGNVDGLIGYTVKRDREDGKTYILLRTKPQNGSAYYDISTDIDLDKWKQLGHEGRQQLVKDYIQKTNAAEASGNYSGRAGAGQMINGLGMGANRVSLTAGGSGVQTNNFFDPSKMSKEDQMQYKFLTTTESDSPDETKKQLDQLKSKYTRTAYALSDPTELKRNDAMSYMNTTPTEKEQAVSGNNQNLPSTDKMVSIPHSVLKKVLANLNSQSPIR
jgi:hypothetical protein